MSTWVLWVGMVVVVLVVWAAVTFALVAVVHLIRDGLLDRRYRRYLRRGSP